MTHPFKTLRLTYRAPEPEDDRFFEAIGKDAPGYLNSNYQIGVPQSKKRCLDYMRHVEENTLLGVVFCIQKENTNGASDDDLIPVGCIHLSTFKATTAQHRQSTIGIDVLPQYQGKGYGSEAINFALLWGFEFAGLHHIKIDAFGWNTGARRLYERLGFVLEGTRREDAWFRGQFYDCYEFGMLDREWRAIQDKEGKVDTIAALQ